MKSLLKNCMFSNTYTNTYFVYSYVVQMTLYDNKRRDYIVSN